MTQSKLRIRLTPVAVMAGLFVLASCIPGAKSPTPPSTRTLELGAEGGGLTSTKAFGVVYASPRGTVEDPSEVTVVFNRPMRPMELAGDESAPPAKIVIKGTDAAPRGAWRWIGTSALVFAPDPHLPRATEYVVTVAAGTKALDGSATAKPYVFSFATPRPEIAQLSPGDGETHLVAAQAFEARFNQPVDPAEVQRHAHIAYGNAAAAPLAVRAAWPDPENKALVKITPASALPLATHFEMVFDGDLRGMEGPLPLGSRRSFGMDTYGPLAVRKIDCSKETAKSRVCLPGGSLGVELSNEVKLKDFKAHVRVEPAPKMAWSATQGDDDQTSWMRIPASLRPARTYHVVITAGLKDRYGQTMARDAAFDVEIGDFPPNAQLGMQGEIFEAVHGKKREIPVSSINLAAYDLLAVPLDDKGVSTLVGSSGEGGLSDDARFDRGKSLPGARLEAVTPTGARNHDFVRRVDLESTVGASGKGAALVGLRWTDRRGNTQTDARVVSVTDLGVTAKMSRFGSLVFVSRLSDAKPVAGATVKVLTGANEVFAAQTDSTGAVVIPSDRYNPITAKGGVDGESIVVVRSGDDWAYRRVADMLSTWRYNVSTDISGTLSTLGMIFTDRGVYRPGETVKVKGIFRAPTARGTSTPAGRAVKVIAFDGNGDKFLEQRLTLDAFGEMALDLAVPTAAHMGTAEVRAEVDEAGQGVVNRAATTSFELAAYRAAEFKVAVEPDKPSYIRGDKAGFTVRGDYLYGAPMSGGKLRYTVTRGSASFAPPGTDDLVLDDEAYRADLRDQSERAAQFATGNAALDPKGTYAGSVALAMPGQHGVEVVSVEGEVEDVSRQSLSGRSSAIVHPAEFYVAMKGQPELFVTKGASLRVDVKAVEPSGSLRAGVTIQVELLKRVWQSVLEASGEVGSHYESKAVDKKVAECTVTSTASVAGCNVAVPDAGYFIVRASAKDPRQNPVAASTAVYALGEGGNVSWQASDSTSVDLVADKTSYEVGDTARILVKSPFKDAEALVTVERSGVYRKDTVKLSGGTPTIAIPITDEMRPNAFVSVHLVRGRTKAQPAKGQDVGAPSFRLGYAELTINPEARRLKVAITPSRKEYRPGEEVDCDVKVSDRAGKGAKSEVTFYAVDEGVLMLTGYKTPDPIPVFTSPRALNVFALESRSDLAKIFLSHLSGTGGDKGDEGGGGGAPRSDFRATAHFEPSLVTDEAGKAHVRFKLPDNLTTYRLMAVVAAQDDRFGFAESQIQTSRPLMARPALPRFLRAGDAMEAGVVVSSKGMPATDVEVSIAAHGVTVGGDAKKTLALPANGSVEVRWPVTAPEAGKATFTFRVSGGKESDLVEVVREVKVPLSIESVALYGETEEAVGEKLGDLRAVRSDTGSLDLRVASTALVGLGDGVEQLVEYPYGCTEQVTSRLIPLLPLRALAIDYNVKLPPNVDRVADEAIAKILTNQRSDGSFGYWADSSHGDLWVSAYALWGLDLAAKHRRHVPADSLERATKYVRQELAREEKGESDLLLSLAAKAFVVDVLASIGKPDPGYATKLYEQREKLPLFARALLAHAIALTKAPKTQAVELLRDLDNHLRITPSMATVADNVGGMYAPLLDSEARTTAMVMRALVALEPNHALLPKLARGLLASRDKGKFRSTQEAAWALLALDDYRHAQERDKPDFDAVVTMNDAPIFTTPFRDRTTIEKSASIPMAALLQRGAGGEGLGFRVDGSGKLFYEARLRYAKKELPRDALDRGFFVKKIVRSVAPEALKSALGSLPNASATSAQGGDLVLIDLLVVTPDPREQVVIEDPLPAGLEALQASFQTTSSQADMVEAGNEADSGDEAAATPDARASGRAYNRSDYHREIQDDRVLTFVEHMAAGMYHYRYLARATTFGRFVVPPTRAECMYEPSVFGRTAATAFEVKVR